MAWILPPAAIRRQRQDRQAAAQRVICDFGFEERAVPAIVLKNEQSNEESRRRNRQTEREQIRVPQAEPHRSPDCEERDDRCRQLRQTSAQLGLTIGNRDRPVIGRSRGVGRRGSMSPCCAMSCNWPVDQTNVPRLRWTTLKRPALSTIRRSEQETFLPVVAPAISVFQSDDCSGGEADARQWVSISMVRMVVAGLRALILPAQPRTRYPFRHRSLESGRLRVLPAHVLRMWPHP